MSGINLFKASLWYKGNQSAKDANHAKVFQRCFFAFFASFADSFRESLDKYCVHPSHAFGGACRTTITPLSI